ncbi:ABC transporter permease [Anaerococcus sp. AGMB00486]|uniref:ABC transporter permease n=2 Tax=Anaerococcus TaxID=165779 RepID=A0ABX2N9T7_9FIRM|nr:MULTISPECIES: ABC transporter permease [Anaerococcus]MSS77623.1 ABC transporter permease [Anaerococcus porci]NVF11477.1 ABC transporter permease [Anaerococcus faecalis]
MSRFLTVSLDTAKKHIKSASFWIMVLMPFIMAIIIWVIGYISSSNKTPDTIAVVTEDSYKKKFEENPLIDFKFINNRNEAKKALEDKEISAYLLVENKEGIINFDYYGDTTARIPLIAINSLSEEIQHEENLKNSNINAKQNAILSQKASVNLHEIKDNLQNPVNMIALFGTIMIMYFVLIIYSQIIMLDIAVEKGSKMLEFIFSSVKAGTYMAGKIFGTILALIIHIGIYIVFGLISFAIIRLTGLWDKIGQMIDLNNILKGVNYPLIAEIFLFMVLGIMIFIILSAMLGSLVQKQEDAGKMSTPIMLIIMFAYFISISFVGSEPNLFIKILSYIPFVSTFFMPMRLIYENATLIQGSISLLILFVGIIVMYIIASRVYKKNILNYSTDKLFGRGKKLKLKKKNK